MTAPSSCLGLTGAAGILGNSPRAKIKNACISLSIFHKIFYEYKISIGRETDNLLKILTENC